MNNNTIIFQVEEWDGRLSTRTVDVVTVEGNVKKVSWEANRAAIKLLPEDARCANCWNYWKKDDGKGTLQCGSLSSLDEKNCYPFSTELNQDMWNMFCPDWKSELSVQE